VKPAGKLGDEVQARFRVGRVGSPHGVSRAGRSADDILKAYIGSPVAPSNFKSLKQSIDRADRDL
jgi:hypothetical protein